MIYRTIQIKMIPGNGKISVYVLNVVMSRNILPVYLVTIRSVLNALTSLEEKGLQFVQFNPLEK